MKSIRTEVIVRLCIEGTHNWSTCNIEEVIYLKNKHRHIFHIECRKEVTHSDRDIEIIMFKNEITQYLINKYNGDFGSMSCEMIAEELLLQFGCTEVKVLEDNENGAIVRI